MLHLRVIAPTESSDSVLEALRREAGVTHIVVHRGAALEPQGDEITADIARESANDVIGELKALGPPWATGRSASSPQPNSG